MRKKLHWMVALLVIVGAAQPLLADEASDQPGLMSFDWGAAIWILISFTILLIILYKAAWKSVLQTLKAREARIRDNIQEAENSRAKAETMLKEHAAQMSGAEEQVRQMLLKAGVEAEKIGANIRAAAQAEGEAERAKTRKEIESANRDAIRQVYEQTAELATTIASKIIGRNLNPQDQQDLVNQTLGQLESMGKN